MEKRINKIDEAVNKYSGKLLFNIFGVTYTLTDEEIFTLLKDKTIDTDAIKKKKDDYFKQLFNDMKKNKSKEVK